jgi:hypothetical protein
MSDSEIDELPPVPAAELLAAIDREQDQLLCDLDLLSAKLEAVLRECAPSAPAPQVLEEEPLRRAAA